MNKYIQDFIRNNSRFLFKGVTLPQRKALSEIIRGFFVVSQPILRRLAQDPNKTAKKQGEKYAHHLGNTDLVEKVEEFSIKKVKSDIRKNTIIAYDLSDIAKDCAKKMEGITRIFDGSKRRKANGFTLHGVGVNGILLNLSVHNADKYTLNQVRKKIIKKISKEFHSLGIWVFDRGNDSKAFFKYLRHILKVQFIARVKSNRGIVIARTGAIMKACELPVGRYEVYLMDRNNNKVDTRYKYLLVIHKHLKNKEPIRLFCSLKDSFSSKQIVNMYLERWGIEDSFKRAKEKFNLEKIRVLNHQKFVNLVALTQFVVNLSTISFLAIQKLTNSLISGVLILYRKFLHQKSLTLNLSSFISFLQFSLKPLIIRTSKPPPKQLLLLPRRTLEKLGSF